MLVRLSATLPGLVNVTVCVALVVPTAWVGKLRLDGDNVGGDANPVPLSATAWGLLKASSVMVTVPVRLRVAMGVKVTLMVQFEPALKLLPQLLLCAKSPVTTKAVMESGALPVLLKVTG
jgi:hypothetical protein